MASSAAAEARFRSALAVVLLHEGGFVNHPDDPGGATNYGISLRFLQKLGDLDGDGWLEGDLDQDGDVDVDDIRALTPEKAGAIYRSQFWDRYGYDRLSYLPLATKVFDMAVNMGPGRAAELLQRALKERYGRPIKVDRIFGPKTAAAANSVNDQEALLDYLRLEQELFYISLIEKNPKLEIFRKGWLRRARS